MTQQILTTGRAHEPSTCSPQVRVTKSLLGYGMVAGPSYVVVSLAQALTRDGFDLGRHSWSLLANGPGGWVQVANLVLTGVMVVAFAVGLRRALHDGPASTWGPRLVAAYGASLVTAGAFRADPALGFPAGTPEGAGAVSWHGALHLLSGAVGFSCLAAACFVIARRYSASGRRGSARASRATGAIFLASFAVLAGSGGSTGATVAFTAAVVLVWTWMCVVAADTYRRVANA